MAVQLPLFIDTTAGIVAQVASGDVLDPTRLGTGTPDATKFLRGDSTWQVVATGSSPDMFAFAAAYG